MLATPLVRIACNAPPLRWQPLQRACRLRHSGGSKNRPPAVVTPEFDRLSNASESPEKSGYRCLRHDPQCGRIASGALTVNCGSIAYTSCRHIERSMLPKIQPGIDVFSHVAKLFFLPACKDSSDGLADPQAFYRGQPRLLP
jgi:hypothetical protein